MNKPLWMWGVFALIILILLILDLGVFNRKHHEVSLKESLSLSAFYIAIAMLFGVWVWFSLGLTKASEYYTGFFVEESLSIDNLFVISLILSYFVVPKRYQHRVLFWGILGVIFLRGIMIALGAALIIAFHWVLYIFAAFLILIGVKMLFMDNKINTKKPELDQNKLLVFFKKHLRVTPTYHEQYFFIKAPHPKNPNKKVLWVTPLLLALLMIDFADVIFAFDSIPAIFAITTDPFIVYTSNLFAILGLRAIYFSLAIIIDRFIYLQYALAAILIFIGSKVFIVDWLGLVAFPAWVSLGVTMLLLAMGIVASWLFKTGI